jgi:hypothetical protein
MPDHARLEKAFTAALKDPDRALPDGIRSGGDEDALRAFNVYRNNRIVSLIDALKQTYPAVLRFVGAEFFEAAGRLYLEVEPPRSPVLLTFGAGFGDFLEGFEPARSVPYLGDLARFEWARVEATNAPDAASLPIERLQGLAAEDLAALRFSLHPSLRLLSSRYPVASLWAATEGGDEGLEVKMDAGEEIVLLRPALSVEQRVLQVGDHAFLRRLAAVETLHEAAETAAEQDGQFDLSTALSGIFEIGAVCGLAAPDGRSVT